MVLFYLYSSGKGSCRPGGDFVGLSCFLGWLGYFYYEKQMNYKTIISYGLPWGIDKILSAVYENGWKSGGVFLDCGCGDGKVAEYLVKKLSSSGALGVDICAEKVNLARRRGVSAEVINLDTKELPFPDNSVDMVFCNHVIEHLFDPDHLLSQLHRVLKKNGILVMTTPNLAAWYNRILLLFGFQPHFTEVSRRHNVGKLYYGDFYQQKDSAFGGHLRLFTYPALRELLKIHNFNVTNSFSYGHPFLMRSRILGIFERLSQLSRGCSSTLCLICIKEL